MSNSVEAISVKYLTTKKLSGGTRKEYKSTVTKWTAWGNGVDVDQINRSHIRDFLDWVHDKAAEDGGSNPGSHCEQGSRKPSSDHVMGLGARLRREASPIPQPETTTRCRWSALSDKTRSQRAVLRHLPTAATARLEATVHGWPLLASGAGRVLQLRSRHRDGVRVCRISRADIVATCVMASGAAKRSGQRVSATVGCTTAA